MNQSTEIYAAWLLTYFFNNFFIYLPQALTPGGLFPGVPLLPGSLSQAPLTPYPRRSVYLRPLLPHTPGGLFISGPSYPIPQEVCLSQAPLTPYPRRSVYLRSLLPHTPGGLFISGPSYPIL